MSLESQNEIQSELPVIELEDGQTEVTNDQLIAAFHSVFSMDHFRSEFEEILTDFIKKAEVHLETVDLSPAEELHMKLTTTIIEVGLNLTTEASGFTIERTPNQNNSVEIFLNDPGAIIQENSIYIESIQELLKRLMMVINLHRSFFANLNVQSKVLDEEIKNLRKDI
ncbi:hypothetical protein GF376_02465, partial [Candidatus Peregrinibacteria bacterium]|nr:hypothetical protein [Candidatus Peregrinibacteria bacterium]